MKIEDWKFDPKEKNNKEEDYLSSNNNLELNSKTELKDDYLLSNDVNNVQLLNYLIN